MKSASETAYWSWYLRARVHTYKRRGKARHRSRGGRGEADPPRLPGRERPQPRRPRDSGHPRGVGDIEHETADVHSIGALIARWFARLSGKEVPRESATVERWFPRARTSSSRRAWRSRATTATTPSTRRRARAARPTSAGTCPRRSAGPETTCSSSSCTSKVFTSSKLTFNEKMGYFVNLATLASAPLLYLTLLRSVYRALPRHPRRLRGRAPGPGAARLHPRARPELPPPLAKGSRASSWCGHFVGALAAVRARGSRTASSSSGSGTSRCRPSRSSSRASCRGWLEAAKVPVPDGVSWGLVIAAVNINSPPRREAGGLREPGLLHHPPPVPPGPLPVLGDLRDHRLPQHAREDADRGALHPRLAGTSHLPVVGRYPSDGSGRFLAMNARFPWLFAPIRFARSNAGAAVLLAPRRSGSGQPPAGLPGRPRRSRLLRRYSSGSGIAWAAPRRLVPRQGLAREPLVGLLDESPAGLREDPEGARGARSARSSRTTSSAS